MLIDERAASVELAWSAEGPRVRTIADAPVGGAGGGDNVWGGGAAFVFDRGRQILVGFPDPLARELGGAASSGEVSAPMTGRVVSVAVAPGDGVVKGALLFTLEAMKMEQNVVAPLAGTVHEVRIAPGTQLAQGSLAISIEPEQAGGADTLAPLK